MEHTVCWNFSATTLLKNVHDSKYFSSWYSSKTSTAISWPNTGHFGWRRRGQATNRSPISGRRQEDRGRCRHQEATFGINFTGKIPSIVTVNKEFNLIKRSPWLYHQFLTFFVSFQLCATKKGREYLRNKNSYIILRELYNIESDKNVRLACENVIDILIKKEEEINVDNYHDHDVPEEVIPKLIEMDENYLKDWKATKWLILANLSDAGTLPGDTFLTETCWYNSQSFSLQPSVLI